MKKYIILAICSFVIILVQCTKQQIKPIQSSEAFLSEKGKSNLPSILAGHGAIFNNGKEIVPDEKFILQTQTTFINHLRANLRIDNTVSKKLELIKKHVKDQVLNNALNIDVLLDSNSKKERQIEKSNEVRLEIANNILRSYYVRQIQKDPILPLKNKVWNKGLEDSIAAILEKAGIRISLATSATGVQYLQECQDAQVPVPANVFDDDGWEKLDTFSNEFILFDRDAELWIYRSDNPPGVCLALPRFSGNEARTLGIICLNTQNGNTCFFDNDRETAIILRDENHPISDFIGGGDLTAGKCTDCHAGENPFIIHALAREDYYTPFSNVTAEVLPRRWYNPLVPLENIQGVWPQNPEPNVDLELIVGDRNCTSCHNQDYAGRLPTHLDEIPGYCGTVLNQALTGFDAAERPNGYGPTMPPPNSGDLCEYAEQVNYLLRNCGREEIDACPDFGFEVYYIDCDLRPIICELQDAIGKLPSIPIGCEVIDCCRKCPYFDDYLDVDILWRSEVLNSIQFTSISEKGKKITETLYKDKPFRTRLKRSQKEFKNEIAFSPNQKENYKAASKLMMEKKIDQVGKIIVVQLADSEIASTQKLMIKAKSK